MTKKEQKDFKVFKSSAGFGLRTLRDWDKGDLVIEYKGKKISNEYAEDHPNRYLFDLDDKWTIDGNPRTNTARYINHSCRPNCEAVHYTDTNEIGIEAMRHIKAGEELTYHYGKDHFNEYIKPHGCKCDYHLKLAEKKAAHA
jgi:SET domain-containing protein